MPNRRTAGSSTSRLHHPGLRRSGSPERQQRVAADEAAGLVPGDREAEPGLERVVGVVDVDAVVAVALLQPQAADIAARPTGAQPEVGAGREQRVVERGAYSVGTCSSQPSSPTYVTRSASSAGVVELDFRAVRYGNASLDRSAASAAAAARASAGPAPGAGGARRDVGDDDVLARRVARRIIGRPAGG